MKGLHLLTVTALVVAVVFGVPAAVWYTDALNAVKHETNRWAVIEDIKGDRMAVEPTDSQVWSELVELNDNGSRRWIGGIVERYSNKWGFRFKPDTVKVAQFTAEGLQATIRMISEDLDYWLNLKWAYVGATVVEIHS